MNTNNSSQIEKYSQPHQFSEVEEGGLNLVEIKETIFRQLPVIVAITAITTSLALFKALSRDPLYQASFEILSEEVTIETKVTSSGSQSRETTEAITAVQLNEAQLKTLKSPSIIDSVVQKLKQNYPAINYNSIVDKLSLITDKEETVLEVSYEDTNRDKVKDVLEALGEAYLNYSLEQRQSSVNRGLKHLNQQIPNVQAKVDELEQELQKLRTKHNFIDPRIQGTQISERLDNLITQQIERKSELEKTQKLANLAKKELNQESSTSTTAMELGTSRYTGLLEDLKEIDHQIAQQSAIFSDKSPAIQTLKEQKKQILSLIDRERATIQQKIDNQVNLQQEQEQALNNEITSMQQSLQQWSGVTREYENIERQMTITGEQLNEFLIQREALRLEASQKEPPWRLLTLVGDPQTDATSTANYMILGTLLGLLVGVGAALILDKHQNVIYTPNQVKEITNQPILGIIPYDRSNKKLSFTKIINSIESSEPPDEETTTIQVYSRNFNYNNLLSPSVEAFRFFAASLGLFEANNQLNSLLVTSAVSGEGKSTIVVNLAKVVAAIGHKVLVVDADLRTSTRLTSTMSLNSNQGLSELLLFNDLSLDRVVQKSFLEENLFILSSGNTDIHVDISKLLASTRMRNLMEELKENFDLVIYDVPAIVDYADVSLLANKTDGVVLVAGLGKLPALKLKEAMNQLNISKTPVLGVVINKVTAQV